MTGPGRRLAWRRLGRIKSAEAAGIFGWANGIATGIEEFAMETVAHLVL